jgi:hypothetical protein
MQRGAARPARQPASKGSGRAESCNGVPCGPVFGRRPRQRHLRSGVRRVGQCAGMSLELGAAQAPERLVQFSCAVLELSVVLGLVVVAVRLGDEAVVAESPLLEA